MSAVRFLESIVRDMKKQLADHTAAYEAVRLQLAALKDAYDELESRHNDTLADLATVQEIGRLREALSLCVDRLIGLSEDGLTKIEQVALSTAQAALAQPAAPSARGRMHSCDIPECVACGNPPDIEEKQEGRDELR